MNEKYGQIKKKMLIQVNLLAICVCFSKAVCIFHYFGPKKYSYAAFMARNIFLN